MVQLSEIPDSLIQELTGYEGDPRPSPIDLPEIPDFLMPLRGSNFGDSGQPRMMELTESPDSLMRQGINPRGRGGDAIPRKTRFPDAPGDQSEWAGKGLETDAGPIRVQPRMRGLRTT